MKSTESGRWSDLAVIAMVALVSFVPFLGAAPLFDWDEINFAESAREMLVTGNYFQVQVNFEPFWEKPPLFIWLQALSMRLFGVTEFAARLPNALVGAATMLALYWHGSKWRDRRFGWTVAGFYFMSLLPFLYFKSGIIDPFFNLLIFMGLVQVLRYEAAVTGERPSYAPYLGGLWIGLATLAKGPVAVLVMALVYATYKLIWSRKQIPWLALFKFAGVYLLVILSWFGSIILFANDGLQTVGKFIVYQAELFSQAVAGHEQPFFYHFLIFLLGCFPLSAFAFRGMGLRGLPDQDLVLRRFMTAWFWVVLILFSIVRTKIVHYSSMLYFPGAVLAALYFDRLWQEGRRPKWDTFMVYGLGFLIFGLATVLVNSIAGNLGDWSVGASNPFTKAAMQASVSWTGWEFLPGLGFLIGGTVGILLLIRRRHREFLLVMAVGNFLFINGLNALVLPRVADYSQNAAIRFFKEKSKEDAYVIVQAYKSYAHYYYGEVQPFPYAEIPAEQREYWLANGPIDKPVYMVSRLDKATAEFEGWFVNFHRIGFSNGFVFYKRDIPVPPAP